MCVAKFDKQHTAKDHVCTHTILTTFFPGKPGLVSCPLITSRWDALPLTQLTATKFWRINGHRFLQVIGYPAYHQTNSVNALKEAKYQPRKKLWESIS